MVRILLLIMICVLWAGMASAAPLSGTDAKLIEGAGIPVFPQAVFVYGNSSSGFRFATSEPVETVRAWYQEKLASWSVHNEFGGWILYNGESGLGLGDVMSKSQVSVQKNDKLPEWHSLDKNMTTEIVIMAIQ